MLVLARGSRVSVTSGETAVGCRNAGDPVRRRPTPGPPLNPNANDNFCLIISFLKQEIFASV